MKAKKIDVYYIEDKMEIPISPMVVVKEVKSRRRSSSKKANPLH